MNVVWIILLVLASAMAGTGCRRVEKPPVANAERELSDIPAAAQPKLPTTTLLIGDQEMITEIAQKQEQVQTGMMFRTNMEENEGMLFVFPYPHQTSFWMKNTIVPLSAAYIDPDGVIQEIHDLQPRNTNAVLAASRNIQFVLETKQGWFKRHNIEPGTLIRTERGSLKETFLQQR